VCDILIPNRQQWKIVRDLWRAQKANSYFLTILQRDQRPVKNEELEISDLFKKRNGEKYGNFHKPALPEVIQTTIQNLREPQ